MQRAYYFAARNDILLFADDDNLTDVFKTLWSFTALGPKVALNWMSIREPEAYLLPIGNPDVFFFENTICLKAVEYFYDSR